MKVFGLTRKVNINWAREDLRGTCLGDGKQGVPFEASLWCLFNIQGRWQSSKWIDGSEVQPEGRNQSSAYRCYLKLWFLLRTRRSEARSVPTSLRGQGDEGWLRTSREKNNNNKIKPSWCSRAQEGRGSKKKKWAIANENSKMRSKNWSSDLASGGHRQPWEDRARSLLLELT